MYTTEQLMAELPRGLASPPPGTPLEAAPPLQNPDMTGAVLALQQQVASLQALVQAQLSISSLPPPPSSHESTNRGRPWLADVPKFSGDPARFNDFWTGILIHFDQDSSRYSRAFNRCAYIHNRLEGDALSWMSAMIMRNAPELHDFEQFESLFRDLWSNSNAANEADEALLRLNQGKTAIAAHISKFEVLVAQSSNPTDFHYKEFLKSLNPSWKSRLLHAKAYNPNFVDDYVTAKKILIKLDSIDKYVVTSQSSASSSYDPMDLSVLTPTTGKSRPKFRYMEPERWTSFRKVLQEYEVCPRCRNYVGKEKHKAGPIDCAYVGKSIDEIYSNKRSEIASMVSSFTKPFFYPILLRSLSIPAFCDTGALGLCFISETLVTRLNLPRKSMSYSLDISAFDGTVAGRVTHTVELEFNLKGHLFREDFLIIPRTKYSVILGLAFFKRYNLMLHPKDSEIYFPDEHPNKLQLNVNSLEVPTESAESLSEQLPKSVSPIRSSTISDVQSCSFASLLAENLPIYSKWLPLPQIVVASAEPSTASNEPIELSPNLPDWLGDYADVFDVRRTKLLPEYNDETAFPIDFSGDLSSLRAYPPYRTTAQEDAAMRIAIDEGLASGRLVPSTAAHAVPVLFVKKPNGDLRICYDYRSVNAITQPIVANLPLIDDIFASITINDTTNKLQKYSKIDLKGAFNQLRVRLGDEPKTTFITKYGRFMSRVLEFGLSNAPAWFQDVMLKILGHLIGRGVWVYLDDILIYEPDEAAHKKLVYQVLESLRTHGLIANLEKCEFLVDSVDFLGHTLTPTGIAMQTSKVTALTEFPTPLTVKSLQSFLGLANYYRKFVPNFASLANPLYKLTSKDATFDWTPICESAFVALKKSLSSSLELRRVDRRQPFILYTDASDYAMGAALHQSHEDGEEYPVGFFSQKFTAAERNYKIYDKELLAVVSALKHWRHLLAGTEIPVRVMTDHKNLTFFAKPQQLNQRQIRWSEVLAEYNIEYHHVAGSKNVVADSLSRGDVVQETTPPQVLLPGLTIASFDEYYTPPDLKPLLQQVLGQQSFDLDPASSDWAHRSLKLSKNIFTKHTNGLCQRWYGNVYVNPPYSRTRSSSIARWVGKALHEYDQGHITSVTMLLRDASGAYYFENKVLRRFNVCFLRQRLTFTTPSGPCAHPALDKHCVAYIGPHVQRFKEIFACKGFLSFPLESSESMSQMMCAPMYVPDDGNGSLVLVDEVEDRDLESETLENELIGYEEYRDSKPTLAPISPVSNSGGLSDDLVQDSSSEARLTSASADELFLLDPLRASAPATTPELAALQDPSLTTLSTWPVHMFKFLRQGSLPENLNERFQRLCRVNKNRFKIRDGKLYFKISITSTSRWVPYVAVSSRSSLIERIHSILGHLATDSVLDALRLRGWWPAMRADLHQFSRSCAICQRHMIQQERPAPGTPLPPTGIPFARWGIDFIQDLPVTTSGNTQIVTAVCHATRYLVAEAVPDRSAKTVAKFLYRLMLRFGAPEEIITDRASCFMSAVLQEYLSLQKAAHLPSTPYKPSTNGTCERAHGPFGSILTKMTGLDREKWDRFVDSAVFIMNARKHSVTGFSPYYLVYGFEPRLPGDIFPPDIYDTRNPEDVSLLTQRELSRLGQHRAAALQSSQLQARDYVMSHPGSPTSVFTVGEFVKLRHHTRKKLEFRWSGPYIIDRIGSNNYYHLIRPDGSPLANPYNAIHLAPWVSRLPLRGSSEGGDAVVD